MPEIQGQAGHTLAQNYDIKGGAVRITELLSREVHLNHEMGGQIFSERARFSVIEFQTSAVAQNTAFNVEQGGIVDAPNRILGFEAFGNNASRLAHLSLAISNTITGREIPIWKWQLAVADMGEINLQWSEDGEAVATTINYNTGIPFTPQLLLRMGLLGDMPSLIMRGVTSGFGAGTQIITGVMTILRPTNLSPSPGEASSHGLPIPSW